MDNNSKGGANTLKKFKCKKCPRSYSHQEGLRRHERDRHEAKRYNCSECPKTFGRSDLLKIHFRIHSGEKPYPCNLCPKAFAQLPDLKKHILKHLGEKHYECTTCGNSFAQPNSLRQHIAVLHSEEKSIGCDGCGANFAIKKQLKRHLEADSIETACEACNQTFTSSKCFYSHREQHRKSGIALGTTTIEKITPTKPPTIFQCEACTYKTQRIHSFKKHQQTHVKGYQFKCHCKMAFDTKRELERHRNIHRPVKNFPCDMCKKVLKSKDSLFIHIRSHLQLKTEKCKICQKSFADGNKYQVSHVNTFRSESIFM